jgi:hypothetical protein
MGPEAEDSASSCTRFSNSSSFSRVTDLIGINLGWIQLRLVY